MLLCANFSFFIQTLRRLAQNREAARKSRLRKKVRPFPLILDELVKLLWYRLVSCSICHYWDPIICHVLYIFFDLFFKSLFLFIQAYVQQLESSRLKLTQLEQELQRSRQQVWFCTYIYCFRSKFDTYPAILEVPFFSSFFSRILLLH